MVTSGVPDLSQIIEVSSPSVVQVFITTMENNSLHPYSVLPFHQYNASAFFIDYRVDEKYYLLTNAHIFENARQLYIRYPAGSKTEYPVEVEFICRPRDLALLSINRSVLGEGIRPLPLCSYPYPVLPGTKVLALGYPLGEHSLKTTVGIISGYSTIDVDPDIDSGNLDFWLQPGTRYQITSILNEGNSGGVLLDFNGKVIGITSGGIEDANNVNYAIPIFHYLTLRPTGLGKIMEVPNFSIVYGKTTPEIISYLKGNRSGILIREKFPDSTLDGLEPGDLWTGLIWSAYNAIHEVEIDNNGITRLRINGEEFPLSFTLSQIAELIPIYSEIQLRVIRRGKPFEWKIKYEYRPTFRLSYIYPIVENYSYLILAGGCWVQYTLNSYFLLQNNEKEFPSTAECRDLDIYRPWIVLTSIFPGTRLERNDILHKGDVLVSLNDREINNVNDLRPINSRYLVFRTLRGKLEVISIDEARRDDEKVFIIYNR